MSEHVVVEARGAELAIRLARPERRNAITVAMYSALAEAIERADADPAVRVITLTGEGVDFAAGNDLGDFLANPPRDPADLPVMRLLHALVDCATPLVAAVHGNCIGIGTTMLLHCDLVIAEENARFLMPFVDLGLVPEAASSLLLPMIAGRRRTARYLLLGEPFGAAEALDIGLASHVAAAGDLPASLARIVAALLAKPPEALAATHRLLRLAGRDAARERMDLETQEFTARLESAEAKAALTAFFASRARSSDKPLSSG